MLSGASERYTTGSLSVSDHQIRKTDGLSERIFIPQPLKVSMQETIEIVGVAPTQRAMDLRASAAVVAYPSERNRAALHQIQRRIRIGAGHDVNGITDEARAGSACSQRQRHIRNLASFSRSALKIVPGRTGR
jgi:hypothetical protein